MKLSDLWTPKGRRATGKLSLNLLKITGKVAVAGTAGLVGALASAAASIPFIEEEEEQSRVQYGWTAEDPGGSPRAEDPDWD